MQKAINSIHISAVNVYALKCFFAMDLKKNLIVYFIKLRKYTRVGVYDTSCKHVKRRRLAIVADITPQNPSQLS